MCSCQLWKIKDMNIQNVMEQKGYEHLECVLASQKGYEHLEWNYERI